MGVTQPSSSDGAPSLRSLLPGELARSDAQRPQRSLHPGIASAEDAETGGLWDVGQKSLWDGDEGELYPPPPPPPPVRAVVTEGIAGSTPKASPACRPAVSLP